MASIDQYLAAHPNEHPVTLNDGTVYWAPNSSDPAIAKEQAWVAYLYAKELNWNDSLLLKEQAWVDSLAHPGQTPALNAEGGGYIWTDAPTSPSLLDSILNLPIPLVPTPIGTNPDAATAPPLASGSGFADTALDIPTPNLGTIVSSGIAVGGIPGLSTAADTLLGSGAGDIVTQVTATLDELKPISDTIPVGPVLGEPRYVVNPTPVTVNPTPVNPIVSTSNSNPAAQTVVQNVGVTGKMIFIFAAAAGIAAYYFLKVRK